jgi:hypothetical protein
VSAWEGVAWLWLSVGLLVWVIAVFTWGLAKANYQEFAKAEKRYTDAETDKENLKVRLEQERNDLKAQLEGEISGLQKRLNDKARRKIAKDLLAAAVDWGKDVQGGLRIEEGELKGVSQHDVEEWVHTTHDFIEAAFDKAEARRFMDSSDYTPKKSPPWREIRVDPYKYHVTPRLQRLNELIVRANTIDINEDFYPRYWMDRFNVE